MFRNMKWLLIGLLIVSTVFYVVGVTLERNTESAESAASVKQESLAEGHDESAESHAEAAPVSPPAEHQEAVFGINLESPGFVAAAVIAAVILIGLLLRLEQIGLVLTLLFAAIATLLDILEVVNQLNRSNSGLATLAVVIALAHLAIGIMSALMLRHYPKPGQVADSSTVAV